MRLREPAPKRTCTCERSCTWENLRLRENLRPHKYGPNPGPGYLLKFPLPVNSWNRTWRLFLFIIHVTLTTVPHLPNTIQISGSGSNKSLLQLEIYYIYILALKHLGYGHVSLPLFHIYQIPLKYLGQAPTILYCNWKFTIHIFFEASRIWALFIVHVTLSLFYIYQIPLKYLDPAPTNLCCNLNLLYICFEVSRIWQLFYLKSNTIQIPGPGSNKSLLQLEINYIIALMHLGYDHYLYNINHCSAFTKYHSNIWIRLLQIVSAFWNLL